MIEFTKGKNNEDLIRFTCARKPSPVKFRHQKVIYGATCKRCDNVIIACFRTDAEININHYEKTKILDSIHSYSKDYGAFSHYFPTAEDLTESAYESTFEKTKFGNFQTIRLKNHIVKTSLIKSDDRMEVGPRPCVFMGTFDFNPAMASRKLMDACKFHQSDSLDYANQGNEIARYMAASDNSTVANTYGELPIYVNLVDKSKIQYSWSGYINSMYKVKEGIF